MIQGSAQGSGMVGAELLPAVDAATVRDRVREQFLAGEAMREADVAVAGEGHDRALDRRAVCDFAVGRRAFGQQLLEPAIGESTRMSAPDPGPRELSRLP